MFVLIKVPIAVNDSMFLLELIGTFSAYSIGLVREGSDTHIGGTCDSIIDKFEHS